MKYKAIFTDIDGTLIPFGQQKTSAETTQTLAALQAQGVAVVVATGRGPAHINADFLGGISPDYLITFNGTHIQNATGEVLFSSPMSCEQFALIEELGHQGHAVGYSFDDGYYLYHNSDKLVTLSGATTKNSGNIRFNFDTTRHLKSMPYVSFCNFPDALAEKFNKDNPSLELMYHQPNVYDLCQSAHNKGTAMAWVLAQLGLVADQAVAIGDAGNDVSMLKDAGLGIAMGNAPDFVKQVADHVTDTVEQNGAATALRQFFRLSPPLPV